MVDGLLYRRPLYLYEILSSFDGRLFTVQTTTVTLSDSIVIKWSTVYCTGDHCICMRYYRPLMVDCLLYRRPLSLSVRQWSSSGGRLLTVQSTTVSLSDTIVFLLSTAYCTGDHCLSVRQSWSSDGRLFIDDHCLLSNVI